MLEWAGSYTWFWRWDGEIISKTQPGTHPPLEQKRLEIRHDVLVHVRIALSRPDLLCKYLHVGVGDRASLKCGPCRAGEGSALQGASVAEHLAASRGVLPPQRGGRLGREAYCCVCANRCHASVVCPLLWQLYSICLSELAAFGSEAFRTSLLWCRCREIEMIARLWFFFPVAWSRPEKSNATEKACSFIPFGRPSWWRTIGISDRMISNRVFQNFKIFCD
jgi:hypothetical protein